MNRFRSINEVVVPFRPPEIHNDILNFPATEYFYFDQYWDIDQRFRLLDNFKSNFRHWINLPVSNFNIYPVNGSTEAITQCLIHLSYTKKQIALIKNEYRYYSFIANQLKIPIKIIENIEDLSQGDVFITSIPFCRDGKFGILQQDLLEKCDCKNIECWLDCAYYGASRPVKIIIPKSTSNIFFSFSKNFGLPLNRIGVWLCKNVPSDKDLLDKVGYYPYGNISLINMLMQKYPHSFLWDNYRSLQLECTDKPTDIIFMAEDKCITDIMIQRVKAKYLSL